MTFTFGALADPVTLDGAFASDAQSWRAIRQVFEGLVTSQSSSAAPQPLLATSWQATNGGQTWTFQLRKGVQFTDGTPFNAKAVCVNFDRWFGFTDPVQQSLAYGFHTVFGAFKNDASRSLYRSCTAPGDSTAVINLNAPNAAFLSALSLPAFGFASPTALAKYDADAVAGTVETPQITGTFGSAHPVGTGPFRLKSWSPGGQLVLQRNDHYWGTRPSLTAVVIKAFANQADVVKALTTGAIDGYDDTSGGAVADLVRLGYQVVDRPSLNVGYVGFNQTIKPLDNLKIRQAIAHALHRRSLVAAQFGAGAEVAQQFLPPSLFGHSTDAATYTEDAARARSLIASSGIVKPRLTFWYPTGMAWPYDPDPAATFQAFRSDLEAVGFTVIAKPAPWSRGFINSVQTGKAQLFLDGWSADVADPDSLLGALFKGDQPQWGLSADGDLSRQLTAAAQETDPRRRTRDYAAASNAIMTMLPGVPYVHTGSVIVLSAAVHGYVADPTGSESFGAVTVVR